MEKHTHTRRQLNMLSSNRFYKNWNRKTCSQSSEQAREFSTYMMQLLEKLIWKANERKVYEKSLTLAVAIWLYITQRTIWKIKKSEKLNTSNPN